MKKCEKYCNLQVHVLYIIYNLVKFCTICFVRGEWKRSTFVLLFYEICMYIIHVHFYYRHHYLDPYLSVYLFFFFSVLILGLCEMRQSVGQKTPFTYGVRKITGKSTYERANWSDRVRYTCHLMKQSWMGILCFYYFHHFWLWSK